MPYEEPNVQAWSMARLMEEQNHYIDAIFFRSNRGGAHPDDVKTYIMIRSEIEKRIAKAMTVSQMYEKAVPIIPLTQQDRNGHIHVRRDGLEHFKAETDKIFDRRKDIQHVQ